MSSAQDNSRSAGLSASTTGFTLAAALTVIFNTALAWAKDLSAPLNDFMKSLMGHHWTTHGVTDLVIFVALGSVFTKADLSARMGADRVTGILVAAVAIGSLGLALWFVFV